MEQKRIYSLNRMAYLYMHGIKLEFAQDEENNNWYAIAKEDCNLILEKYRVDLKLHAFLNSYKILRNDINNLRLGVKDNE